MKRFVGLVAAGEVLDEDQVAEAAAALVAAGVSAAEKAEFLAALARRGESPTEIAAFVRAFLKLAVVPPIRRERLRGPLLDVVGTGGDKLHLFNVSTTAMFILAGGGVCISKHGNRGVTSKSGGADVLEALGVNLELPADVVAHGIEENGVGFLFAPRYHPAFREVVEARKLLAAAGQRSMFNLLGPLLNPVNPDFQLIGVFDPAWLEVFAEILRCLDRKGAWIVHGSAGDEGGMDEVSTLGGTQVCELRGGEVRRFELDPAEVGCSAVGLDALVGGDAAVNAEILLDILEGRDRGPKREIAMLNAAAGFVVTGMVEDVGQGMSLAAEALDSGAAREKLAAMVGWGR